MLPENNAAVIRIQKLLQQLRADYLAELPDRINELEQRALTLKNAANYTQQYGELYRMVHSLKGGAGTYGVQIISTICHQLEDSLERIANDAAMINDNFLDRCIAYFDLMRLAIDSAVQGKTAFPEVESALATMRAEVTDRRLAMLLVEPSKVNSMLYFGALKSLPIQFSAVESGYEALGLLLRSHYDLLITGHETPLLNGLALIAAVRLNQGINHDIRTILITSSTDLRIAKEVQPDLIISRNEHVRAALLQEVQRCMSCVA